MWLKNEFIKLIFVKTTYLKAKLPLRKGLSETS